MGIYGVLHRLLAGAPGAADHWVTQANDGPLTEGRAAIDIMTAGGILALHRVRMFLEAEAPVPRDGLPA